MSLASTRIAARIFAVAALAALRLAAGEELPEALPMYLRRPDAMSLAQRKLALP